MSGVSSYAVTRLNWSKSIFTERIKDCQALTDLDKNFMKYREELRIASPPCLPYIGLIKQDLYQVNQHEDKFYFRWFNKSVIKIEKAA